MAPVMSPMRPEYSAAPKSEGTAKSGRNVSDGGNGNNGRKGENANGAQVGSKDQKKRRGFWSVLSTIIISVILIVALVALVVAVCYRAQGETLTIGGMQYRIVLTGSMEGGREDSIRAHSIIGIEAVPKDAQGQESFFSALKEGDVITFNDWTSTGTADDPVVNTHRIIEVIETEDGREYRTQGDANDDPDARAVAEADIIGKVVWSNYALGAFLYFLCSTTGMVVCLIVPAAIILIYEVVHIIRILQSDKRRKQSEETDAREQEIERLRAELEELKRGEKR